MLLKTPRALMSSPASFLVSAVLLSISLPVNGFNFGSISISLQVLDNIFAVRSLRSLCLIDTKPPFLQLMQCCMLNLLLQRHVCNVGKFTMFHPYHKQIACQKCLKPKSLIDSDVSQFDTPFSKLTSSNLLDFFDILLLNWSELVWHRSCFSFFCDLFSYFDLILADCILLSLILIGGASWVVSVPELVFSASGYSWKIRIASQIGNE